MAKITFKAQLKDKALRASLSELKKEYPNMAKAYKIEKVEQAARIGREKFTPFKTGNLKSTLRHEVRDDDRVFYVAGGIQGKGKGGSVFVNYAYWVNRGTSKFEGFFFLEKSAEESLSTTNSFADEALRSWLKIID